MKSHCLFLSVGLVIFFDQVQSQPAGSYYAPTVIQGHTIDISDFYPEYDTYYGPTSIFSPSTNGAEMTIKDKAFVEFKAGNEITLTDGFTAGPFDAGSGTIADNPGEFRAYIENSLDVVVIAPDESQLDPADHLLHVKKWEKFEWAIKLPQDYEDAIINFFARHLSSIPSQYNLNPYISTGPTELNPYAFDSLEVKFDFISPSNVTYTKYGFFMREVTWGPKINNVDGTEQPIEDVNNPLNDYHFHVRFAPTEETAGNQVWRIKMSARAPHIPGLPAYSFYLTDFKCDPPDADKHGYLKVNPTTQRNLQFDDDNGTSFFGFGENLIDQRNWHNEDLMGATNGSAWNFFYKKNYDEHIQTINELSSVGANMIRLIVFGSNYAFTTEDLNSYDAYYSDIYCLGADRICYGNRQYCARKMDELFDKCYEKNIYVKLNSLISFPQTWGEWGNSGHNMFFKKYVADFDQNPNILTPNALPIENFFRNSNLLIPNTSTEEVEYYWKRYFKYLMSRWGYSINLGILEPMGEVDQTMGYRPDDFVNDHLGADICENHRGIFDLPQSLTIRTAINDWYTMVGRYIRDWSISGGLKDRNIPIAVSYTDFSLWSMTDWNDKIAYCNLFYNNQIDLVEFHRYSDKKNAFKYNADLTQEIFNGSNYGLNKPFACGELATFGSIPIITQPIPPPAPAETTLVATAQYYNNYDISHHNEIWGSAFMGNFHSGFTWFTETAHRYVKSNPPPQFETARELGESFHFVDLAGATIPNSYDNIIATYLNFAPFKDFLDATNLDFNDFWIAHSFFDSLVQHAECYYITNTNEDKAFGWMHNTNFYWANNYYYWAKTDNPQVEYYSFDCNTSNITTGIELEGLTPGAPYDVQFYYTRTGTPPLNFPAPTQLTADNDGKLFINGLVLGTYLGCEKENADVAFSLTRYPNRPGSTEKTDSNPELLKDNLDFSIFPNPGNGLFHLQNKSKNQTSVGPFTLKVSDLSGRLLVYDKNFLSVSNTLNLTSLAKGCYFISISQNNKNYFSKIIIQ